LAYLAFLVADRLLGAAGKPFGDYPPGIQNWLQSITVLSGGFIVTSLLWGTGLARIIDGRVPAAAATFGLAAVFALFGIIHSPLPSSPILLPEDAIARLKSTGRYAATAGQTPYYWAAAYFGMAVVLLVLRRFGSLPSKAVPIDPAIDDEPT
jgi:AGZA family xanthine/uracil permease-like MFS transporter